MSQQDLSHYIPRFLDAASKFLFWEIDVAGIAVLGMLLGLAGGYPLFGLVFGIASAFGYAKLKGGRHPGMAAHLIYWWTGMPSPKDLPGSHLRDLNG